MIDTSEAVELSELELDALTELANLSVSRAASSLRDLVNEQVLLSVPGVQLISRSVATERIGATRQLVAVHQVFEGRVQGRALLIFPEAKSLELVKAIVGEISLEDLMDLETEALAETGNIILSSCLSTIGNMLERTFTLSLPEVLRGDASEILNLAPPPEATEMLLFLHISFTLRGRDISGYIAMLMDVPSLLVLRELIDDFIERTAGSPAG